MKLSDMIADFINTMLESEDEVELQRSELAGRFGCAPSQINYVIGTRFSPEHGFYVESRRGGGGYIRITRASTTGPIMLMHAINSIGGQIDQPTAEAFIQNLYSAGILEESAARILLAQMGDQALAAAPQSVRGTLRAGLLKTAFVALASMER